MSNEYLKLVIVGHVDHGKSTLIGRLLIDTDAVPKEKIEEVKVICDSLGREFEPCYILDYLEEEREQNITIDTTQIWFKTEGRNYVIIDAPGHKEFLKNMISGTSLAEAAILMLDASEGVKEQTKRHAYILSLLGIKQLIVAVNKMDLVQWDQNRFKSLTMEINEHLAKISLKANYIVPLSAKSGQGLAHKSEELNWYSGPTVLEALDSFKTGKNNLQKPLRFAVQDVYKIDNERIVAGRLESGALKQGDEIIFLPAGEKTTVKEVKMWNQRPTEAFAGQSIGLTLNEPLFIDRGLIACHPANSGKVTSEFSAKIFWLSKNKAKTGDRFTLRISTQEIPSVIEEIHKVIDSSTLETVESADEIGETQVAEVKIKTDKPIVIDSFNDIEEMGRFVLQKQDEDVLAGGIIN